MSILLVIFVMTTIVLILIVWKIALILLTLSCIGIVAKRIVGMIPSPRTIAPPDDGKQSM